VPTSESPRPLTDPAAPAPWRVEILEESPSTNAYVAERARAGEAPGLVAVTEHQTAGRGRLDRTWDTPRGVALTFSMLVSPGRVPLARWPWLPLLTGLAVVDAVEAVAGVAAALKWPNDVMVEDGKLAGILVELVEHPAGASAVVGVGLNVSASRDELPVETATSLALEGAADVDRTALLGAFLTAFSSRYDAWVGAGGEGMRAAYREVCSTIGRQVRADLPGGDTVTGTAVDVDGEGRLHVDDGSSVHVLGAGDVVHVRPG
jgi:BirA family transcriptional regulator, biotin operon repressor / biotin---[acetyl-CoA-carboxylase] ligase